MITALINLDKYLFYLINHKMANPFFDWFMPFITSQANWMIPILIILLSMLIFGKKRARISAILLILTVATTDPLCYRVLKPAFRRIRPSHSLEDARLLMGRGGKYGFPSNHAANITGAMFILGFFFRKYKYPFAVIAALISYSRIYVGVHFPADVLFGIIIGIFIAIIWLLIWIQLSNHLSKQQKFYLTI